MVKKIEKHIKEAFKKLGFEEEQINNGCWLLERNTKDGVDSNGKPKFKKIYIAWIATHKFLERVATKAKISFEKPEILENKGNDLAILVQGKLKDITKWSIGEVNESNYPALRAKYASYRWAMAEKRAKDRVILKLLDLSGDMYSEEEAAEFKNKKDNDKENENYNDLKAQIKDDIDKLKTLEEVNNYYNELLKYRVIKDSLAFGKNLLGKKTKDLGMKFNIESKKFINIEMKKE